MITIRRLMLAATALAGLTVLAGCGHAPPPPAARPAPAAADKAPQGGPLRIDDADTTQGKLPGGKG